jgi:hypothetical protein
MSGVRRREFFIALIGLTVVRSRAARAQQSAKAVGGFLSSLSRDPTAHLTAGFLRGLGDAGFVDGRAKHIELLHELVPAAAAIALLVNPSNSKQTEGQVELVQGAARSLGVRLEVLMATSEKEFGKAFETLKLWAQPSRGISAGGHLRWAYTQGRYARRPTGSPTQQVRAGYQ